MVFFALSLGSMTGYFVSELYKESKSIVVSFNTPSFARQTASEQISLDKFEEYIKLVVLYFPK